MKSTCQLPTYHAMIEQLFSGNYKIYPGLIKIAIAELNFFSGSYLANYVPKTLEEFEPGVTKSVPTNISTTTKPNVTELEDLSSEPILQETDRPFSSGSNSDILF